MATSIPPSELEHMRSEELQALVEILEDRAKASK